MTTCNADLATCATNLGTCTTDLTQMQADLATCQAELQGAFPGDGVTGPALSYQDNGDGTITDLNTRLMWEKKDTSGGIHGVNHLYSWSSTGTAADGTAFTVFLYTLNNKCDGDETTQCTSNADCTGIGNGLCGHAGFRDWRMPNVKELQSIVDYGKFTYAIDSTFLPTSAFIHWSSTSITAFSGFVWTGEFVLGSVGPYPKFSYELAVRAVRGGQ